MIYWPKQMYIQQDLFSANENVKKVIFFSLQCCLLFLELLKYFQGVFFSSKSVKVVGYKH